MAGSNVRLARLLYDFKGAVHSLLTLLWSSLFEQYFQDSLCRQSSPVDSEFQATGGHGGEPKNVNV